MAQQAKKIIRTAALGAVLAVLLPLSAIGAELAAGKTDITITGDVAFGSRLLRDADSIRYVTPYLDTRPTFLPVGQDGSIYVRLYFVNRKMPHREISSRLKKRDWMGLLGRVPKNADTTPGRIVRDHRWGVLARECPGLLHTFDPPKAGRSDGPGPFYMAPNRLRLLKADIDNDGIVDTVLHRLYRNSLAGKIATSEGFEPNVYGDPKGIPTIGTGYALLTRDQNQIYSLRNRDQINDALSTALHGEEGKVQVSDAVMAGLTRAADAINRGDAAAAKAESKALQGDKTIPTLTEAASGRLAASSINDAEKRAKAQVGDVADRMIEDGELTPDQKASFLNALENSREMQALTSLSYNGAPTPKAIEHMLKGDRVQAHFEIAYSTNRDQSKDLANRRVREGMDILGDESNLSDAEKASLERLRKEDSETRKEMVAYENRYPDAFKDGGSLKTINPPAQTGQGSDAPKEDEETDGKRSDAGDGGRENRNAAARHPGSRPSDVQNMTHRPEDERPDDKRNMPFRPGKDKPELRDFVRFATEAPEGKDAIMLKAPERITQDEMISLIHQPGYDRNEAQNRKVRLWHEANFGTDPVPRDATGRQIDAGPMRTIPKTETPPRDGAGGGLIAGMEAIAGLVARSAGNAGLAGGVRALQSAVNDITEDDDRFPATPLKTDGIFGRATRERLRNVVVRQGTGAVATAFRNFRI